MATKKNAFRSLFMGAAVSVAALMAGAYSPDAEARCLGKTGGTHACETELPCQISR